jgi:recombination protein RecT
MPTETTPAITSQTAIAPANASPKTVKDWLSSDGFKAEVQKALPTHLTPDRFLRVALTALNKTPKLADCTPSSVLGAMLTLSQFGLEPDGRRAHLIPYGKECQLIVDYKGIVELVLRSGLVSKIHADVVCENDAFEYDMGEVKQHKIDLRKARGEAYAFYAVCTFKDGTAKADVMSREEVDAIRARSRAGRAGPWVTDYNEMGKKTVFRRLSKWLPLSAEIRDVMEKDDDVIDIVPRQTARAEPLSPFALPDAPAAEAIAVSTETAETVNP